VLTTAVYATSQPYRKVNIQGIKVEVKKARSPNDLKNNQGGSGGYNRYWGSVTWPTGVWY